MNATIWYNVQQMSHRMNSKILAIASRKHPDGIPFSGYNLNQLQHEAIIKAFNVLVEEGRLSINMQEVNEDGHVEMSVIIREYFNATN